MLSTRSSPLQPPPPRSWRRFGGGLVFAVFVLSCSATSTEPTYNQTDAATNEGTGGTVSGGGGSSGSAGLLYDAALPPPEGGGGFIYCEEEQDDLDHDGDGYSFVDGDCDDCDPNVNPGAFDVKGGYEGGPSIDEDCNGVIDDEPSGCDQGLVLESTDPWDFVKALGLCRVANASAEGKSRTWGVLEAKLGTTEPDQSTNPLLHGILPKFGTNNMPQEGTSLVVLSSGTARDFYTGGIDPLNNGYDAEITSSYPPGFPKNGHDAEGKSCPGPSNLQAHDAVSLYLRIRAPKNANSLGFDFSFFSSEYPDYLCSQYNDLFAVLLHSQIEGDPGDSFNIAFDGDHNPICVNTVLFSITADEATSHPVLIGTLRDKGKGGSTGWLSTQAPVSPGEELTLQFVIWDTTDPYKDSAVIIDNFRWSIEQSQRHTEPIPVPK